MASLLDAFGVLQELGFYSIIFPFILIFAIVYGLLTQTKIFGDSPSINGIIAATIALLIVSIASITVFITAFLQITIAFFVIVFLIMLIFLFMGVKAETIGKAMTSPVGYITIIILFLIFFFISISAAFPGLSAAPVTGEETTGIGAASRIIGSPTVLGLIVMFVIFTAAAAFVTYTKD